MRTLYRGTLHGRTPSTLPTPSLWRVRLVCAQCKLKVRSQSEHLLARGGHVTATWTQHLAAETNSAHGALQCWHMATELLNITSSCHTPQQWHDDVARASCVCAGRGIDSMVDVWTLECRLFTGAPCVFDDAPRMVVLVAVQASDACGVWWSFGYCLRERHIRYSYRSTRVRGTCRAA